ncbi:Hypothetical predicted protein [Podarcis lilfordi]|uniref:RCC1 domain containing 1 n=1 Tax=Podarcis lilfordi TaxID=74358 RepID=A0AA35L9Z6_9SAUR|nr:Hypothetical predicted protein [Podarcis lilfordi]
MAEGARGGGGGGWFQFGFCFGKATEAGLEVAPLLVGGEAGPVRCVRPSWSFSGIVRAGGSPPVLLQGAVCAALPEDCRDVLPSETHVLVLREAAVESWPVEGSALVLEGEPAWRCEILPEEAATVGSPPVLLQGAVCAALPEDCRDVLASETHVLVLREAAVESWPVEGSALVLEGEPAWRCEILPEEAATVELPLVPGGYVAPRPPFFTPLPSTLQARKLALGYEHAVLLNTEGALFSWGGGRHGQLGHGELESRTEPQLVEALYGVPLVDVAAGGWHSAGISEAGDLYVWGWNETGQLALPSKSVAESRATTAEVKRGDMELRLTEQEAAQGPCKAAFISIQAFPALLDMPDGADVCKISCGSRHTAAVTCTGELYTWGWGKYGQLGHGQTASSDEAKRVSCFVDWGLRVVDVVCGPWTTYVHAVAR